MKTRLMALALLSQLGPISLATAGEAVDIYKNPNCGCCGKWAAHLEQAGFNVRVHEVNDVSAMRAKLGMPERYASCHTAKIGGYVVEGHVPADDVKRLLKEKPKAIGIAVPAMPPGSPGMETPYPISYATLLVQNDGSSKVYAQH